VTNTPSHHITVTTANKTLVILFRARQCSGYRSAKAWFFSNKETGHKIGSVGLLRLSFVRDKSVLIAARGLPPSNSKQNTSQQRVKRF
jgi:hypothetical protein